MSRTALAIAGAAALTLPLAGAVDAAPRPGQERLGEQRWAVITRIDDGFRYRASEHDSRLVMTRVANRVRFHDRALRRFLSIPPGCRQVAVERGIAATCRIPDTATPANPLLLEIVPRLGNDRVDGSELGAEFKLSVLADAGDDVVFGGAGDDFVNGSIGVDRVHGGPGNDWIRTGDGNDVADGGAGHDRVVGTAGSDQLAGSVGNDLLEGGIGNDLLLGGPGEDVLRCGDGYDTTDDDGDLDSARNCEATL
jgi:serralysin